MAKLHFYYSAMNAGKSTTLLQSSHNYNERGMDTLIFTPAIDTRTGKGRVSTRIGLTVNAEVIEKEDNIFDCIRLRLEANPNIGCVLIDEAQFLTKQQVFQLAKAVDQLDIPVLTYGLRSDFQAEPFPGSQYLLALADNLIEIKTICHCGKKATMNLRIDANGNAIRDGEQVQIGGNEAYVATCREHFFAGIATRQTQVFTKETV